MPGMEDKFFRGLSNRTRLPAEGVEHSGGNSAWVAGEIKIELVAHLGDAAFAKVRVIPGKGSAKGVARAAPQGRGRRTKAHHPGQLLNPHPLGASVKVLPCKLEARALVRLSQYTHFPCRKGCLQKPAVGKLNQQTR